MGNRSGLKLKEKVESADIVESSHTRTHKKKIEAHLVEFHTKSSTIFLQGARLKSQEN